MPLNRQVGSRASAWVYFDNAPPPTNRGSASGAPHSAVNRVLLGVPPTRWSAELVALVESRKAFALRGPRAARSSRRARGEVGWTTTASVDYGSGRPANGTPREAIPLCAELHYRRRAPIRK